MWFTTLLQSLLEILFAITPRKKPSAKKAQKTQIVAHRGSWKEAKIKENTLEAFNESLKYNVWGIEFDIRWSKDQIPMVHHDSSTQRVFPSTHLKIETTNFKDLRKKIPEIPTLEELVELYGKKLHLMIEIKEELTKNQVKVLCNVLGALDSEKDYHFMCLKPERLTKIDFVSNTCFLSIARINVSEIFEKTIAHQFGAMTGQFLLIQMKHILKLRAKKIKVGLGFPTSRFGLYREIHRKVDWVFTNHPTKLQKIKDQLIS